MIDTSKQTLADALGKLGGRELSSVTFVQDYVQLAFDGPNVNAYTTPSVSCGAESLRLGQTGYRDALCKQIGSRVERAEVSDQQVAIFFREWGHDFDLATRRRLLRPRSSGVLPRQRRSHLGGLKGHLAPRPRRPAQRQTGTRITSK